MPVLVCGIVSCLTLVIFAALFAVPTMGTSTDQSNDAGSYSGGTTSSWEAGDGSSGTGSGPLQADQQALEYGLWITDSQGVSKSLYQSVPQGSVVQFISYSLNGGQAKLYDIQETGSSFSPGLTGGITALDLPPGYSQGSYKASAPGRHTLMLIAGQKASNAVVLDVVGFGSQTGWQAGGQYGPGGSTGTGMTTTRTVSITYGSGMIGEDDDNGTGNWDSSGGTIYTDSSDNGFMTETYSGQGL